VRVLRPVTTDDQKSASWQTPKLSFPAAYGSVAAGGYNFMTV
jgi:hypothetical protein